MRVGARQGFDGTNPCQHLLTRGGIGRMHEHSWWLESTQRDSLLNPQHDVIARAALIVSKIMA